MPLERQLPQHKRGVYYSALQPLDDSIKPESYPHFISKEIKASEAKPGWSPGGSDPSCICIDQLCDPKQISGPQFPHL